MKIPMKTLRRAVLGCVLAAALGACTNCPTCPDHLEAQHAVLHGDDRGDDVDR